MSTLKRDERVAVSELLSIFSLLKEEGLSARCLLTRITNIMHGSKPWKLSDDSILALLHQLSEENKSATRNNPPGKSKLESGTPKRVCEGFTPSADNTDAPA